MVLAKIISGGQTGVDRGALEAARACGFPYGGLIPKGRLAEDGIVPLVFDQMEVAPRKDYLFRTKWNVVHSDCTLLLARVNPDAAADPFALTGGTLRTQQFAAANNRPCLVLFDADVPKTVAWLREVQAARGATETGLVLNVAGPRESKAPGIQSTTKDFISRLIEAVAPGLPPAAQRGGRRSTETWRKRLRRQDVCSIKLVQTTEKVFKFADDWETFTPPQSYSVSL